MGVVIPQVIAEDRASGAQVIDGSLNFKQNSIPCLEFTPGSDGNRSTWTISFWARVDPSIADIYHPFFLATADNYSWSYEGLHYSDGNLYYIDYINQGSGSNITWRTNAVFRDTGWYHIMAVKVDNSTLKLYVNGEEQTSLMNNTNNGGQSTWWNVGNQRMTVGGHVQDGGGGNPLGCQSPGMSQFYFIDGQQLGPEYFGFTDPLTNTWKPKKVDLSNITSGKVFIDNTYTGGTVGSGIYNAATGTTLTAGSYSGDTFTATNAAWVITFDLYEFDSFTLSDVTSSGESDETWYYSNDPTFASGVTGPNSGTIANGTWSTTVSGTKYRYLRLQNVPSITFSVVGNITNPQNAWGVNGFYLPMDGNSPIGEDKSGNENNWTPVSFGGSNTIEKATGALPILNTVSGGRVATVGVRTDATVAAGVGTCVLALPFANPGGSTKDVSNQIDSGSTEKVITASGNAVGFSTNNFYGRGWYFDGQSTTYVEAAASNDFVVGTGDFTIEGWFNPNATQVTNGRLWGQQNPGTPSEANADYDCYIGGSFGTSDIQMNGGNTDLGMNFPTAGEWHHIAVCRSGTTLYSFMNGVLKKITPNYTNNLGNNTDTFRIAKIGGNNTGYAFAGGVQDFRFYNGVAKYTSDFIPASINPDILPDTPSGVSGGSELAKIANGSVGFAGTSRLSVESTSDLNFGTDNFTIEGFFNKVTTTGGNQTLLASQKYYTAGNNGNWVLRITDNANIAFATYDGQSNQEYSEFPAPNGADGWHHFALVREGTGANQTKFYYDGKLAGSTIVSKSLSDGGSNGIFIGHDDGPNNNLNGFLSNVRIVKGTAVYTSDFTPPTEPLTNITNTKLLCAQSASEHKDITGRLYKSGTVYTTKTDIIANATPLEGGETLSSEYLYYVPSGNELTRQQIFSADGAITNGDSSNSWSWVRHDGTNWLSIIGGYNPGQFDEFYFDADDTTYQLDPGRDFYALTLFGGTSPSQHGGTAPTLRKQFALDGAVIPSSTRQLIDQLYEPTVSNFNPFTTDINTVRGQETNHCTLNPLSSNNTNITLSEGNLYFEKISTAGSWGSVYGTIGMTTGKWYWEAEIISADENIAVGVSTPDITTGGYFNGSFSVKVGYVIANDGDHWGFAIDMDNRTVQLYKNGIEYQTNTGTGTYAVIPNIIPDTVETLFPCVAGYGQYQTSPASRARVNFGQKPFKFPPPDGFQPLNDANAKPETVIARPDQYVGVTTYSGNVSSGTGTQQIKVGTQPDLVWIKKTSGTNAQHRLVDSVRGPNEELYSDTDQDSGSNNGLNSFDPDGFTVWTSNAGYNELGQDYVAWTWKAGGEVGVGRSFMIDDVGYATTSAAGFNPQATEIAPDSASISTKAGFSIVKYTGSGTDNDAVLHGLLQKPDFVIVKNITTSSTDWRVWSSAYGDNRNLRLNRTGDRQYWNEGNIYGHTSSDTAITLSCVPSTNLSDDVNLSGNEYIMYSWHNVPGLQKFGSYLGNGDADGTYIELGFRPALVIVKLATIASGSANWFIYDSRMEKYNTINKHLIANSSGNIGTGYPIDFLSNGFKLRYADTGGYTNLANSLFIYAAWAESPSINLYGGQSNAR